MIKKSMGEFQERHDYQGERDEPIRDFFEALGTCKKLRSRND
jgi:hypothetical protein